MSRADTTAARAISRRARTANSTGSSSRTTPDILADLADRRDACDPDERQFLPQHHRRSLGRRRCRRDRGPAALSRDHPAMVDLASGILFPAAQIQDRGLGRQGGRPRRREGARHRPRDRPQRGRRSRVRGAGRRRDGAHADIGDKCATSCRSGTCCPISRPCCASTTSMARRDNLYKSRIKILVQHLGIAGMREAVEAEWAEMDKAALALSRRDHRRFRPPFRAARSARWRPRRMRRSRRRFASDKQFARWVEHNTARHKVPGYAIATISLKPDGRPPGDCTARADGSRRRSRRGYSAKARSASATSRTSGPAACPQQRSLAAVARLDRAGLGDAQYRARHRHHRLPRPRLLRPCQCPLDSRSPSGCAGISTCARSTRSASSRSRSPAASTPAAITMSAISAFSASTRTARSSTRSPWAAAPTRTRRWALSSARRCRAPK